MKIHISNNWINDESWWVYKVINKYFDGQTELVSDPINCDIFLYSTFGVDEFYKVTKAKYKIFCTWETRFYIDVANERMKYADYSLSYVSTNNNNLRIPLWHTWIDWWNENNSDKLALVCGQSHHYIGKNVLPDYCVPTPLNIKKSLYTPESVYERENFCAMLVGNTEASSLPMRAEIFNEVSSNVEQVHGYGLAFNNRFEGNKIELLRNYRFNICYENSNHVGYVTEKLFDAKFAGCIPLYYGDPLYSAIDFNPKCFLNRLDYDNLYDYIKEIKLINSDKSKFIDIASEPLFTSPVTLDYVYTFFDKVFK